MTSSQQPPHGAEPGASSEPTEPPGSAFRGQPGPPPPGTNQGKAEPMPLAPEQDQPQTMASGNPQAPSAGAPIDPAARAFPPANPPDDARDSTEPGSAFRVPGSLGRSPDDSIETDAATSVQRTAPGAPPAGTASSGDAVAGTTGNTKGVYVHLEDAAPGTSENSEQAHGVRTAVSHRTDSPIDSDPSKFQAGFSGSPQVDIARRPHAPDGEVAPE